MNARQRKLFELKQKMNQARKANENAIIAERKRMRAGDPAESTGEGSKKKWYEEKKKRQEEQLAKLGLTPEEAHRLESAEVAEAKYKKKEKKPAPFGWDAFNQQAVFNAAEKRASKIKPDLDAYNAAKAAQPERALEVDALEHGKHQEVAPEGLDAIVAELYVKLLPRVWTQWWPSSTPSRPSVQHSAGAAPSGRMRTLTTLTPAMRTSTKRSSAPLEHTRRRSRRTWSAALPCRIDIASCVSAAVGSSLPEVPGLQSNAADDCLYMQLLTGCA
jgi:hypothetical protein